MSKAIDGFNYGTRIMVTHPNGRKYDMLSIAAFTKKFFTGNRTAAKNVAEQLRDRNYTTYQGYYIERIKSKY